MLGPSCTQSRAPLCTACPSDSNFLRNGHWNIFFFWVDFTFSLSGDTPVSLSPLHTLPPNICPWPSSLWHHYEVICPLPLNWISDLKSSNLSFVSSLSSDLMETGKTFNTFAMPTFYHKSFSRSFLSVLAQSRYHRCRGKAQTGVQGALL